MSGSYEQIEISVSPNTILYFDTSSAMTVISASTIYHTASNAIFSETAESASYALTTTLADVALIADRALTASHLIGNVELSESIVADLNMPVPAHREGQMFWDSNAHTYAIHPDREGLTLQIGQEQWLRVLAHENIPNGAPVYISHAAAGIPCAELAQASGLKYAVVGIATEYIPSGSVGIATTQGQVHELDLSAFTVGSGLFLDYITSGSFTQSPPPEPYPKVICGYVLENTSGSSILLVNIIGIPQTSYPFVGITSLPSITSDGSSSFTIGVGKVNLCTTANGTGTVKNYTIPSASFTLDTSSLLDVQHIVATYNSGNPIYQLVTDRSSVNSIQTTLVSSLTPVAGGSISQVDYDSAGNLLANKLLTRIGYTRGIERATGLALAESASKGITISAGTAWMGAKQLSLPAVNSSGSCFILLAHSASAWSGSLTTGSFNTIVDNGTTIVPLSNNKFVVNYVYREIGSLTSSIVMLSPEYATLATAQASQPPTPPSEFLEIAFLTGRMIYQQGVNTAIQVDSAFAQNFTPSGISTHNDLNSLQGGQTGEYYHLTATEYGSPTSGSFVRPISASVDTLRVGNMVTASARVHISGSNGSQGTAPLKFQSSTALMPIVEPGAFEYWNHALWFSNLFVRRSVVQAINVMTGSIMVGNTTNEIPIYTVPHGPNYLRVGKMEEINLYGLYNGDSGAGSNVCTFRIYWSGSLIASFQTSESLAPTVQQPCDVHVTYTCRQTGSSGQVQLHGGVRIDNVASDPDVTVLATFNTLNASDLVITAQWSDASPINAITMSQGRCLCIN